MAGFLLQEAGNLFENISMPFRFEYQTSHQHRQDQGHNLNRSIVSARIPHHGRFGLVWFGFDS